MKPTIKFLARLYPSRWRKRYGAELDALLEDATPSVRDAFDIFWGALKMQMTTWNFGRIVVVCSAVGVVMAAAASLAVPVHYLSEVTLILIPGDGNTPVGASAQYLANSLTENVLSRESLTSIIEARNLYPRERARISLDEAFEKMRRNITVAPLPVTSSLGRDAFTVVVKFDYPDSDVAQQVNADLASHFIKGGLNSPLDCNWLFRVLEPPSLPLRPVGLNGTQFVTLGLFTGLSIGLALAAIRRSFGIASSRNS
jgi:uncharacterized protein involved in exopolysaccharide biosynthesis